MTRDLNTESFADVKAMLSSEGKAKLEKLYQAASDAMTADEKAASDFAGLLESVINKPTIDGIETLKKAHDALSEGAESLLTAAENKSYDTLINAPTQAVKDLVENIGAIDISKLTPDDKDKIAAMETEYNKLSADEKKLVDNSTSDKLLQLSTAVSEAAKAEAAIDEMKTHPDGTDLGIDCTGKGHTIAEHKSSIEAAKLQYEHLTDVGRALVSAAAKVKLNAEYTALMRYLDYVNTASSDTAKVEVAGPAEKVQTPAAADGVTKTVIRVTMKDEKTDKLPETIEYKIQALSVDIKLNAQSYRGETPVGEAVNVQPKQGETVLVKLKIPAGYKNDTLEIWHVMENGTARRIVNFWKVTESDGVYAVFEVSSFSHFVFFAEKISSGGSGSGTLTPKPEISGTAHGSVTVNPQQSKPGENVVVTPKPDAGYVVDEIAVADQNGKKLTVKDNGDGTYSCTQPSGKVTVTVTFKPSQETALPFADVSENSYYKDAVKWAYENGVTDGTAAAAFSPDMVCTRARAVTFLWRAMGSPEPTAASNPFADVKANTYYTDAVLWAVQAGITAGTGASTFSPADGCTGAQIVTFLYRCFGK